jgi:hypothetical protein
MQTANEQLAGSARTLPKEHTRLHQMRFRATTKSAVRNVTEVTEVICKENAA